MAKCALLSDQNYGGATAVRFSVLWQASDNAAAGEWDYEKL